MGWFLLIIALYFVAYHLGIEEGRRRKSREDTGAPSRVTRLVDRWR